MLQAQSCQTGRLSEPATVTVTVDVSTVDVTTSSADHVTHPAVIAFSPGQTSQTFSVQITNDYLPEYTETFNVRLANPTNAILADSFAVGTIVDDEAGVDIVVGVSGGIVLLRSNGSGTFGAPCPQRWPT